MEELLQQVKWRLERLNDGLVRESSEIKWIAYDKWGYYLSESDEVEVGKNLLMSPFEDNFTWLTTKVIKILEKAENTVKFETENSTYILTKIQR